MQQGMLTNKVPISANTGFSAPMDDADANTRAAVAATSMNYMVAAQDAVASCLPEPYVGNTNPARPILLLPGILRTPDDMLNDMDEDVAVSRHQAEVASLARMSCAVIARLPNQTLLTPQG